MQSYIVSLLNKRINILLLFVLITCSLSSQNKGSPQIRWIRQFPPLEKQKNNKSIVKRIAEIVVGKKEEIAMVRPVSILASNPDTFLVLDQGYGALMQVKHTDIDIPHGLKKKFNDFGSLIGMCYTPDKSILFTDSRLNHIYKISSDKKELKVFDDTLVLQQPTGIAYAKDKHQIWVVETAAHHIRIMDDGGKTLKIIGNRGTGPGEFNFPTSICIDDEGIAYVVDAMNFRIQLFNKEGEYLNEFGEVGDANGYFARPKGIATDTYGNIYVVDALFHGVQIFDKKGNLLFRFGQQGHDKEEFWMPSGIFIDNKNYIYVADSYNSRVQVFQLFMKQ